METTAIEVSDEMVRGYLETAHFADCPEESKHFLGSGKFSAGDIGMGAFTKASQAQARQDCEQFMCRVNDAAHELINTWAGGSDLWYTRNGHGVGFWEADRGWGEYSEHLADVARGMGRRNVFAGRYLSIN